MPFQNEIAASTEDPFPEQSRLFQQTALTPPALGRAAPGAGISFAVGAVEAALIAAAVLGVLLTLRSMQSVGPASWIVVAGLPLITAWVLARRRFYTVHHLLFAPFQPLALLGAWIGGFGLALVLTVLARSVEPIALRHLAMLIPETGAMFAAGLAALLAARLGWAMLRPRYAARGVPRVLFVGALDIRSRLRAQLDQEATIDVVGSLDYRDTAIGAGPDRTTRLAALLARERVDAILLALPHIPEAEVAAIAAAAQSSGVTTLALPGLSLRRGAHAADGFAADFTTLGALPVLRPGMRCLSPFHRAQKRAIDLILALMLLAIIAPVMAIIALAIRLETPGPVLFRQVRVGRGGALFEILKFRTMRVQPPPTQAGNLPTADLQTGRDDRRVTRFGTVLRRHSLDELPQLLNVLRGEMSVVGPRPHASAMTVEGMALEALVPDYPDRFMVRPGITGWAQINGRRGMIDTANALQSRVDHDLYYIENWSVGFDLTILARTVRCIIRDDRAF